MTRLRIRGLVRLMNQVRDTLASGIPPGGEDNFRNRVMISIEQVEQICEAYKTSPDQLPAPTYRAYLYLKELDLKTLPVLKYTPPPDTKRLRVRNLISTCQEIQEQLAEIATLYSQLQKDKPSALPAPPGLQEQIQALVTSVEAAFKNTGTNESSLSTPARRAYRWVSYLSQDSHLQEHIAALQNILLEIERVKKQTKSLKKRLDGSIHVEMYNMPAIYTVKQGPEGIRIQAHEGFIGAPDGVIQALVRVALAGKSARDTKGENFLRTIKEYSNSPAFRQIASDLAFEREPTNQTTRGQHFDLEVIFNKVNRTYFSGTMPQPNLAWNKTLTHRKFGHYHAASDTVMISISLDRASIPAYVLEFVMYHELLHKQLGTKSYKGRQYAHTRAFREAEAIFPKRQQAEAALNEQGRKLLKGRA